MCAGVKSAFRLGSFSIRAKPAFDVAITRKRCIAIVNFDVGAARHSDCSFAFMFLLTTSVLAGFVAGLMSLPHCAFMCGPLAGAACGTDGARSRSGAAYIATRALAYTLLGALAGGAGGLIDAFLPPTWARTLLAMSLALGMVILAVRLFRASSERRAVRTFEPELVPLRTKPTTLAKPMLLGALTALLPCGSLYAALLVAGATASALTGALSMFGFALGSAPALVLWQSFARWSVRMGRDTQVGLGVVFLVFAGLLIARGWPREDAHASCHVAPRSVVP